MTDIVKVNKNIKDKGKSVQNKGQDEYQKPPEHHDQIISEDQKTLL